MEPTKIIVIDPPFLVEGNTYAEIKLREPIINEVITAFKSIGNKSSAESYYDVQINLASKVSTIPVKVLEELPARLLDEAIEYLTSFQQINAVDESADMWEMPLDPPLQLSGVDGDVLSELLLQEPTVKQRKLSMRQMDQFSNKIVGGFEAQVSLLTSVSGQKMATILKLPVSQFFKASNYLTNFFPNGQETGKTLAGN